MSHDCDGDEDNSIVTDNELRDRQTDINRIYNKGLEPGSKEENLNNNSICNSSLNSKTNTEDQIHVCPYCDYSSVCEMRIQAHIVSQHTQHHTALFCPLCQEEYKDMGRLEKHLTSTHSVKGDGLQRLLLMVDKGDWIPTSPVSSVRTPTASSFIPLDESGEINTEVLEAEAAKLAAEGKRRLNFGKVIDFGKVIVTRSLLVSIFINVKIHERRKKELRIYDEFLAFLKHFKNHTTSI
ncbi:hypothetical protein FSP39_024747 [Pinctada imbricata]|uniref:C2H2-type domain-containing protein n=1 Tax=Pinctada imbricata TaxID=66713 RepID=A0AA88XM95_PINIB|nr:hypothetical protein FSP39_024747 [Pinctada imbricata]